MRRELVIGLDIGTTSVKAVIFDLNGKLIAEAEKMITTYSYQNEWKEQDIQQIERLSKLAIKEVTEKGRVEGKELCSIGISCAMHSLICVDNNNNPLSPMIIWSDGRSYEQVKALQKTAIHSLYMKTGTPMHPMTPLSNLIWMKKTGYEPYKKASRFMTLKEFLLNEWFGENMIDYSMASSTGLMNIHKLDWEEDALELAGIERKHLGKIVPPTEILTTLKKEVAEEMGIETNVPFAIGAADGQLANLGSGAITSGEVNVSVGTSGAVRQFVHGTPIHNQMDTFTYSFTDTISIIGGSTNNGGIVLQWLKDLIESQDSFQLFLEGAATVEPGAEGVIFLPYVNGERAPLWNQQAKGNFYGLSVNHSKEHLIRAALEGITFNIYKISKSLEEATGKSGKISVNGGLSQSTLWLQIMADVFNSKIHVSNTHHNVAWGAAWVSLVALNKVESFEDIKNNMPGERIIHPNKQNSEYYKNIYKKYEEILNKLSPFFV